MSVYRNSVWFLKGLKEYTKSGYLSASKHFNSSDLEVSCEGRSYMITGANSGIGKTVAIEIAKRGGTVHLVCRNKERGEEACEDIKKQTNNDKVQLHLLDMSKPRDIVNFAKGFENSGEALHVLVNNAGCMVNKRELQEDDIEKNFATNTLGTHLLTVCLTDVLEKGPDPRVVIVSSGGMLVQKLDYKDLYFENMKPFDGTMAYAQNKRQQIVMTQYYAKKFPKIHISAMHPGWADTPAVRLFMPDFYEKMKNKFRTAEEGADTALWLAISPAATKESSGQFFQDRKPASIHLPLAWTKSSPQDEETFMTKLEEIASKFITAKLRI